VDKLKAYGIGKKIYSIVVEKGHGYIRPSSYDDFIGGTIFVGYTLNQPITEDMLVVVPEGTYDVTMRNGELVGSHSIEVKRNQETVFDMSEYKQLPENKGEVIFKVTPVGADLYVNGKLTDFSKPVLLNYGEHSIEVILTGYNSYSGILDVKSPNPTVVIDLAEEQVDAWDDELLDDDDFDNDDYDSDDSDFDDSDFDDSDFGDLDEQPSVTNKPSESTVTATDNTGVSKSEIVYDKAHTITVSEPAGAEIYLNGEYKGIVPSAFPKQIGTQVVTLSKNGYITKSFTIVIPDDGQDITWKFPNLDKGN